jgi:hypothetical protein
MNFHEMAAILDYGKVCPAEFARTGFGLQNTPIKLTIEIQLKLDNGLKQPY